MRYLPYIYSKNILYYLFEIQIWLSILVFWFVVFSFTKSGNPIDLVMEDGLQHVILLAFTFFHVEWKTFSPAPSTFQKRAARS